ncbi:MFS transporter [Adlercreutzia shanghongiae]|uniref:MFS transporter n=1 Tax=Adlercreutzia shanghongiae TaxID=3111773 RepID=A0ABU6IYB5_9ACTN|nr:MFS transporter [Adlercreutzia sp. R22]MEC4294703.1 MFS transporter [Adlercreutzia sp. R22]
MHLSERGHTYALFAIVVITCALGSLTQTVMNSMLTGVCADFAIDAAVGQWVTTIYMLVMGITVPVVTFLSRRFSLKRLVFLALGFYLAGSVVGFFAPTFSVLVVARVLQAIATGITLPLVQAVAMTRFPRERTGTAMGIGGIAMGFAPNIGPLIGGALAGTWGWRSFYVILAGLLVLLWAATALLVESHGDHDAKAVLDFPSFVQSTLGFGGLLLGASNAASLPFSSPQVWVPVFLGVAFIVLFLRRQRVIANPLICLDVFKSRHYRAGFVAQNCLFASFMGITLVLPLFVQGPCAMTALDAGIVFIPATVVALFVNPLAGVLVDRVGPRAVCLVGATFLTVGAASFMFVGPDTPLWVLTFWQGIRAIGVSALVGPLNSWGLSGLNRGLMMDGSAFFAAARQACASLGTALMMMIVSLVGAPFAMAAADAGATVAALPYQAAFALSTLFAVGVFVVALWKIR